MIYYDMQKRYKHNRRAVNIMNERDWELIEEMYCNCDQDEIEEEMMCVD